jgi:hypothetical protein
MPGNVWLILLARMSSVVTACAVAGAGFERKRASTYMIAVSVRLKFKCGDSDLRGYLIDACKAVASKKDHAPA